MHLVARRLDLPPHEPRRRSGGGSRLQNHDEPLSEQTDAESMPVQESLPPPQSTLEDRNHLTHQPRPAERGKLLAQPAKVLPEAPVPTENGS